jgi:hypothetical protein
MRELRLSAARVFLESRLSLGLSLNLGQGHEEINFESASRFDRRESAWGVGFTAGAMYRLPQRVLLGLSLSPPTTHDLGQAADQTPELPGFYQSMRTPTRIGAGIGWIPNRLTRFDFTTFWIGSTADTALLRDETRRVGETPTLQPRLGGNYLFVDYRELTATLFFGTYYEVSRITGGDNRLHLTYGVEIKPWIFTIGIADDSAAGYRNQIFSFGIDIFKVMAKLDLIPKVPRPDSAGIFPNPFYLSDSSLTRPLVENWEPSEDDIDPIQAGLDFPKKLGEMLAGGKSKKSEVSPEGRQGSSKSRP